MELLELRSKAKELGLDISDKMLEQFDKYAKLLIEWNSFSNYEFAKRRGFHDLTHE